MGATMATRESGQGLGEAKAQLDHITGLIANLDANVVDETTRENAIEAIQEHPLDIEVRSAWTALGTPLTAAEYNILLCTGGPAVRIVGTLDMADVPDSARLEHQEWFTPWTPYPITQSQEAILIRYAQQFCYA